MSRILNSNLFLKNNGENGKKTEIENTGKPASEDAVNKSEEPAILDKKAANDKINVSLRIDPKLVELMGEVKALLGKLKVNSFASEVDALLNEATRQRFSVAVVGEFSRGKSSFINKMFGRDILPVANMPTTAMLTRIRYAGRESITIYDTDKKQRRTLPLTEDSWDEYIADDNGNDPNGVAFVGLNSPWLKNGIEIIDTPGAGDLEAKRAAIIGDALKASDSAIITISAEAAMSMSEKLFIEERLISKKTPFLMLVITKLDRIHISQRSGIVDFVREKLRLWNMPGIPVYIPYNIEMPDNRYDSIVGMDKVINQINSWISASDRKKLTEQWLMLKLNSLLQSAINFVKDQKYIVEAENDEKRKQIIDQKMEMLSNMETNWEDAKLRMLKKGNECYELFLDKASGYKESITERLHHELSHSSNPKKWWDEDYPYRLKIEMTNMSVAMENVVSRQVSRDVSWFNSFLEKNFRTSISYNPDEVADKDVYTQFKVNSDVDVKDVTSGRALSRIGVTTLSIASALLFTSVGVAAIVGTMGVGTGGSILSDSIFKKKIEAQKETLKEEIARSVPKVVNNAMVYSENRVKNIYTDIIAEADQQQEAWKETQKNVINSASSNAGIKDTATMSKFLEMADTLSAKINRCIEF